MSALRPGQWADLHAPSLDDFQALATASFNRLPQAFRDRCDGISFLVLDFPEDEMIDALDLDDEFDLLGLYTGIDLTRLESLAAIVEPNRIYLFRRPLLDLWAEGEETLDSLITHVLVHEIGHHFGLSDDDMESIESQAH